MKLDTFSGAVYKRGMTGFVRLFVFALLAAFAVATVAHATSVTAMSLEMALADGGAMAMADCQGCGADSEGGDSGPGCDMVCVAPLLANLGPQGVVPALSGLSPPAAGVYDLVGRTGPPEPYPPRTLV